MAQVKVKDGDAKEEQAKKDQESAEAALKADEVKEQK